MHLLSHVMCANSQGINGDFHLLRDFLATSDSFALFYLKVTLKKISLAEPGFQGILSDTYLPFRVRLRAGVAEAVWHRGFFCLSRSYSL